MKICTMGSNKAENVPKKRKRLSKRPLTPHIKEKRKYIKSNVCTDCFQSLTIVQKKGVFQRRSLVRQLVIVAGSIECQQKGYRIAGNVVVVDDCV